MFDAIGTGKEGACLLNLICEAVIHYLSPSQQHFGGLVSVDRPLKEFNPSQLILIQI
jgi:hypothetical protein